MCVCVCVCVCTIEMLVKIHLRYDRRKDYYGFNLFIYNQQVAETTAVDIVHCLCDHLTAFGGQLFVAPNPVDFDEVFTEFTRLHETGNVAVIIAVSCVFGLYLLLFVWARKADQKDALKVCLMLPN